EAAAYRPPIIDELSGGNDVGAQAVDLFLNVRLGRQEQRFLRQTLGRERGVGLERRELFGKASLKGIAGARWQGCGGINQRNDLIKLREQHGGNLSAFLTAGAAEAAYGFTGCGQ